MKQFDSAGLNDNNNLYINFRHAVYDSIISFDFSPPQESNSLFPGLNALYKIHGEIKAECLGGGLLCCPSRAMVEEWFDDEEDPGVLVFDVCQNVVVAHPNEKNIHGEPKLCFIDHEDGEPVIMGNTENLSARQVFLRLILQCLGLKSYFDEVTF
jgi:hypothetical protein